MNFAAEFSHFVATYGLAAIFLVMLLNEMGVPVPIPSDLIMLAAAAGAAQGRFPVILAFLAIVVPMVIGGTVQYGLAKGPGRYVIYRYGKYVGLTKRRLNRAMHTVHKGGLPTLIAAITTPGIRLATSPASGLARIPLKTFVPALAIGSSFYVAWHFALGYAGGRLLMRWSPRDPVLIGLAAALVFIGLAGWVLVRRRKRHNILVDELSTHERVAGWAEASCPVCVTIVAIQGSPTKEPAPESKQES